MHITLLRFPTVFPSGQLNVSSISPPLSLACLAAFLKARGCGYRLNILDALGEDLEHVEPVAGREHLTQRGLAAQDILARIPGGTDVLGVSCMFSSEWPFNRTLLKTIKAAFPRLKIIAGGEHVSALPELVLTQAPEIDFVVIGEGEETFSELLATLSENSSPDKVRGIAFRRNGGLVRTPARPRITALDALPAPLWDAVPLDNYFRSKLSHGPYLGKTMPILASRGCPYSCKFCSNAQMWGNSHTYRAPRNVVDEIELYVRKYGVECVEFYDLTPIIGKAWLHEFCVLLSARNLAVAWQMSAGTRSEALDPELIALAAKAGCKYLGFAPESGAAEILEDINKKLDLAKLAKTIKTARGHRLGIKTNFIIGFPEETRRQIFKTLLLQLKFAFLGVTDAPVFKFTPYPGSAYFKTLLEQKVIPGLSDEYFESLGLNFLSSDKNRYCRNVGPLELALYQLFGTALFYLASYSTKPLWLLRAFRSWDSSSSVFEQRLKQHLKTLFSRSHTNSSNR